jgi:glycosyltransferase involved in cell wall biosynthesis
MGEYYANVVGVNSKKIKILYNDIDLSRFTPAKESENSAQDVVKLLMVHRLSPVRKTMFYLPYIIQELANKYPKLKFHLTIVGGGPEKKELEDSINRLKLASLITLSGPIPNKDIAVLYQKTDIFIQPSYNEGFPRVVLEAMASGLPIVATDAGGTHQIVGKSSLLRASKYIKTVMVTHANKLIKAERVASVSLPPNLEITTKNKTIKKGQ